MICPVCVVAAPKAIYEENIKIQKLKLGSSWSIPVKYTGYPRPEVSWMLHNKPLSSTKHTLVQTTDDDTVVTIHSVTKEDSGTYTLKLENEAGSERVEFILRAVGKSLCFMLLSHNQLFSHFDVILSPKIYN